MSTINRSADGSITVNKGGRDQFFSGLTNITTEYDDVTVKVVSLVDKQTVVSFVYADITEINGDTPPETIAEGATLLAQAVFFFKATGDGGTTNASDITSGTLSIARLPDEVVLESELTDIDETIIPGSENAVSGGAVNDGIEALRDELYALIASGLPTLEAPSMSFGTSTTTQNVVNWTPSTNATGYVLQFNDGGTWTTIYTGALLTYTHTGRTPGTSYDYRVRATAPSYNTSVNATGSQSTASAGLTIIPIVFAGRGAGVTYSAGPNAYGTTYPGSDGWNFPCNTSGKKLAAGADGAVYLTCDGVNSEVVLGFNTVDSGNYYSMPVGLRFGSLAYPDLLMLDNDGYTYLEPLVNGTKYRLIRISGVWKIQKSTDDWVTPVDVATLNYSGAGDHSPVADMHTTSITEGAMINPLQSGLIAA